MKKLLLIICLLISANANADAVKKHEKQHLQKKQQLFASLDYCSNIGSKEIFNLGTKDLKELGKYITKTKNKFNKFKEQKTNCFDNSADFLNDIIADNLIFMQEQPDNALLELQNKVDQRLAEAITLRKNININLIDSILKDLDYSLAQVSPEEWEGKFISESKHTKKLISQELNVIYDSMENQLDLDQSNIDLQDQEKLDSVKVANVALRAAFLNLSRALLLFENIEHGSKSYNMAKVRTHIASAHNKLLELKAFSNNLDGLDSKKDINIISNQLSIIAVDLDISIKELNDETFSQNYLNWAGKVYNQTSDIVTRLQKVLDTIYLIDITKEPMPIDITIREESLNFEEIAPITKAKEKKNPTEIKNTKKVFKTAKSGF